MRNLIVELQVFKEDNEKTEKGTTGTLGNKRSPAAKYSDKENPKG